MIRTILEFAWIGCVLLLVGCQHYHVHYVCNYPLDGCATGVPLDAVLDTGCGCCGERAPAPEFALWQGYAHPGQSMSYCHNYAPVPVTLSAPEAQNLRETQNLYVPEIVEPAELGRASSDDMQPLESPAPPAEAVPQVDSAGSSNPSNPPSPEPKPAENELTPPRNVLPQPRPSQREQGEEPSADSSSRREQDDIVREAMGRIAPRWKIVVE